jgi:rhomboid protease GluP
MAFASKSPCTRTIPLDTLSKEQFLVVAIEAARQLEWNIGTMYETGFLASTPPSPESPGEKIILRISESEAVIDLELKSAQLPASGFNDDPIDQFLAKITVLKTAIIPEESARQYELLKSSFLPFAEQTEKEPSGTFADKIKDAGSLFIPRQGHFITPILIYLNVAVYLLMVLSGVDFMTPESASLLKWGANFRPLTLSGEWWRLLTNCFLHIGLIHLLMNMYALLYIGALLEPHLNRAKFATAYLLTGIAASVTSLCWHELTISAGASGAIFGMYGLFLAMLTTNLIEKSARQTMLTSILIFVGYNLAYGAKGNIDNAAHIGGLLSGMIIGYAYYPSLRNKESMTLQFASMGLITVLVLSGSAIACLNVSNDIGRYDEIMKSFGTNEQAALNVLSLPENTPKETALAAIKTKGIFKWNENIALVNEADKLDIPVVLHEKDKQFIEYCQLRIKCYELVYKSLEENNSDKYTPEIKLYVHKIDSVVGLIK